MRVDRQLCAHIDYHHHANGSTHAVRCWDSCVGPRVHCPEHAEHAHQMTGDRRLFHGGGDKPQCSCEETRSASSSIGEVSSEGWRPTLSCRAATIAGVVRPFLETYDFDRWRPHLAIFCALLLGAAFLLADI